ncbi:MAG TPA: MMPL family transporter [Mycobacterium sp.]|jgi:RND superfamily putative drug exporter|uniref:MMPL family transporter n=1 Tax=Mycobacterium sp. TaxID=1785 RepID=UPI002F42A0E3
MSRPVKGTGGAAAGGVFGRLGDCVVRRPLVFIGLWVALAAGLLLTLPSLTQIARERPVAILPSDAPALVATQQMTEAFHESGSQTILLVVLTDDKGLGPADEAVYRTLVDELRQDTGSVVTLQDFLSAPPLRDVMTSKDHRAWYLPIGLAGELGSPRLHEAYGRVADIIKHAVAGSTLTASLAGPPATDADLTDIGARELPLIEAAIALLLFIIVLVIYRNPVTTLLPLITNGISLVTAQAIVAGFCQLGLDISNQAIVLMTGITCGAGIGYAVFLISRYHDYVLLSGDSDLAVKKALTSVGKVIAASAATLAVTFLGMMFTQLRVFKTLGPVLAIAICVTLLAAVTLLPAMLALAGRRGWIAPRRDIVTGFWRRSGMRIVRRPKAYLLASLAVLIILAGGARLLRDNYDDRKTLPDSADSSVGYAALARHFSLNSTIRQYLVIRSPNNLEGPETIAALRRMAQRVREMPDIAITQDTTQLPGGNSNDASETFSDADGLLDSLVGTPDESGADTTPEDAARIITTMRALGFAIAIDVANIPDDFAGPAVRAPDPSQSCDVGSSCSDPRLDTISDDESLGKVFELAQQLQSTPDSQTVESATQSLRLARDTAANALRSISIDDVGGVQDQPTTLQQSAKVLADAIRRLLDKVQALLNQPAPTRAGVGDASTFVVSPDGYEARYLIQTKFNPFSTAAIDQLNSIVDTARESQSDPALADATISMAGFPATLQDTRDYYNRDIQFIIGMTVLVVFLILIARLRAIVAPAYLIVAAMVSYLSALGIGVIMFQFILGQQMHWSVPGLTFIVLVTVGADCNMLLISRIRDECPDDVRSGVVRTLGSTGAVIAVAGIGFAASMFALLLAGISTMAQAGFVIGVGLLLDTLLVRTVMVPAMAVLVGRANWWPSRKRLQPNAVLAASRNSMPTPSRRGAGVCSTISETGDQPMLELAGVSKTYRLGGQTIRALDGITLAFSGGEFVSVVGPSGSGKSTLLHLLGALDRPDCGSIRFQGKEISDLDDYERSEFRRRSVGFVFQFFNLLPTMTAWENVAVPMLLDGARISKVKPRALELLSLVDLADRAEHRPSELSGGQMQRVAVARALMMDPPLVLADEPTGNLDTKTGAAIMALLNDVAHQQGRSVVMVTHNVEAASSTDRVITLADGRIGSDVLASGEHP